MSELNISLVHLSLKFIKKNYSSVSRVSRWIYFELSKFNYKESKFIKSLNRKDIKSIKILINFNENINLLSEYLITYCCCDHLNIAKLLIDYGANVHHISNYALRYASANGYIDMVKLLLTNGADVHVLNDEPLKMASYYGHLNIIDLLLINGANVRAQNDMSLFYAKRQNHLEIVKFLKSKINII